MRFIIKYAQVILDDFRSLPFFIGFLAPPYSAMGV